MMKTNKAMGKGEMNMGTEMTDRIKSSLARPKMDSKPTLTDAATKKGKDFLPKGFGKMSK